MGPLSTVVAVDGEVAGWNRKSNRESTLTNGRGKT